MKANFLLCSLFAFSLIFTEMELRAQYSEIEPQVSVEFSVYAWRTDTPILRYSTGSAVESLESSTRSAVHQYSGPATLEFYSNKANLTAGPKRMADKPVALVTFPEGAQRFTILAISAGGKRVRMYAMPEDGDLLPARFVLLHNFTDYTLGVTYNDDDGVQIPPQDTAYIRLDGLVDAVVIHVSREENGHWRKLFNNVVELNNQGRANVILASSDDRPVILNNLPPWPGSDVEPVVVDPEEE